MGLKEIKIRCKNGVTKKFHIQDLIGERFEKLVAKKRIKIEGKYYWNCLCDCGNKTTVAGQHLINGHTRSCGCLIIEARKKTIKHGDSGTIEYKTWRSMISRCYNPKNASYGRYQKNGIGVCSGWFGSYGSFLNDMGRRPINADSIERPDNDKSYSCGHCEECKSRGLLRNGHWDTWAVQGRNRSTTVFYEYNGEKMIIKDWAKRYNIEPYTLLTRIKRGWDFKVAAETPTRKQHNSVIR